MLLGGLRLESVLRCVLVSFPPIGGRVDFPDRCASVQSESPVREISAGVIAHGQPRLAAADDEYVQERARGWSCAPCAFFS